MSPPRTGLHLASPPPPDRLTGFPHYRYGPGSAVFRCHGRDREPWWFSGSGAGRFDLTRPDGTCYTAESEVVALLETFGGLQVAPDYLIDQRAVSTLRLSGEVRAADMTSNAAIRFGVTAEVFTTVGYPITQLWAAALHRVGFGGIRYWARHDLAHHAACLALFGPAGQQQTESGIGETVRTEHLAGRRDLLSRWETETGMVILPVSPI